MQFTYSKGLINITDGHPDIAACKKAADLEKLNLLTDGTKEDYDSLWATLKGKPAESQTGKDDGTDGL